MKWLLLAKPESPLNNTRYIDVLRHGATETPEIYRGITDDPLSAVGEAQMWAKVGHQRWDHIATSPLSRCRGFAQSLGQQRDIDVSVDARLIEYNFGEWDGLRFDELNAQQQQQAMVFFSDPFNNTPPAGQAFGEFMQTVQSAWHDYCARPVQRQLLVCHGGVILAILAALVGTKSVHSLVKLEYACYLRFAIDVQTQQPRLLLG